MSTTAPPEQITRAEARQRLAFNMRRLFEARGTSSRQVAREHGLCYRVLQRAAAGQSDPSWSLMWNLANALGVPLPEFAQPLPTPPKKSKNHR